MVIDLLLAEECLLEASFHTDDTIWLGYLVVEVHVVGHGDGFRVARLAHDCVV